MKKNLMFSVLMAVMVSALALASCSSSKKAKAVVQNVGSTLGELKEKSPAQLYAEDPDRNNMRAWGSYNGFADQNLEALAAATARSALAEEISVLIKSAVDRYEGGQRIDNRSLGGQAENVKTTESQGITDIESVSKELIAGSRIAVSNRYIQKDGTETCYIAVEISIDGLINNVKQNSKLQEAISKSRKEEIEYDSRKFKESMQSVFEELKEAKGQ